MIIDIMASAVLVTFTALTVIGTLQMLHGPYDEKLKWLVLSALKVLAYVGVTVAVWL